MPEEATGEATLIASEPVTTEQSWFTDDYKDVVAQKGWKEPSDVLKSYTELEKTFSGRVKMPTPESSAEEIRAFYQKTGCPENPDGYEIPTVEGAEQFRNEAVEKELAGVAHEMGVSKQAFEAIVGKYYEQMATDMVKTREASETALKEELGDKYDEGLAVAQRFAGECSDEFRELMETTGLGNNPIIVKEFMNLGKKTLSDSLIRGEAGNADDKGYTPQYKSAPEMYATGEDEESVRARKWFEARGHKY
jgi:hypothetical protein